MQTGLEELEKLLDTYEKNIKIIIPENLEVEQYIHISKSQLEKMTAEEIGYGAITLSQYALYLQKLMNRETAVVNWIEGRSKPLIGDDIASYKAYSFEEKKMLVIKNSNILQEMFKVQRIAKAKLDRISYLSARIEFLAKMFSELQQTKRRNYGKT